MHEFYRNLFKYDDWANRRVIESLKALPITEDRPLRPFSHLLATEHNWHCRLRQNREEMIDFFPLFSLDQCADMADELARKWAQYIEENQARPAEPVSYRTTEGREFTSAIQDILFHVANHSTHHRGQVAVALRHLGYEPAVTDYIVYTRKRDNG